MKKLILFYLYGILIIPISLRVLFGNLAGLAFHPGLIIHFSVLLLLILYFFKQLFEGVLVNNFLTKIIFGFFYIYFANLLIVEFVQFASQPIIPSIEYTFKIFLFLFLSHFIYQNHKYYSGFLQKILLINSIVFLLNVIIGNQFQIGWQSYEGIENTYRGFLAGNDTSIFSFVTFAFTFYSFQSKNKFIYKLFYLFLMLLSVYSIYIIATKAVFVSIFILLLFLIRKKEKMAIPVFSFFLILSLVSLMLYVPTIQERMLSNYLSQANRGLADDLNLESSSLFYLFNYLAPGRIILGIALITQQFSGSLLNIVFGYGVSGIYQAFGRPPMADFFSIIGYYGLVGFIVFYVPQLYHMFKIIYKKSFSMINVIYLSIFLYGSFGGFLYGVTNTSVLFALVFSLSLKEIHTKNIKI